MSITQYSGAVQLVIDAASVPPLTFDLGDEQPQFKAHERKSMAEVKYLIIAHDSSIHLIIQHFLCLVLFLSFSSFYHSFPSPPTIIVPFYHILLSILLSFLFIYLTAIPCHLILPSHFFLTYLTIIPISNDHNLLSRCPLAGSFSLTTHDHLLQLSLTITSCYYRLLLFFSIASYVRNLLSHFPL